MSHAEPIAWLNGNVIPFRDACLPVFDLGIVQGATITERLRTFRHTPYLVEQHLQRLQSSAFKILLTSPLLDELDQAIDQVARHNCSLIDERHDLSIVIFATAGQAIGDTNGMLAESKPTVCVYSAPLPLASYSSAYHAGVPLLTPTIRQIAASCIDPEIKMRSRLHWYLADQQVRQRNPKAQAILLNDNGELTETSSGNLFLVRDGQLLTTKRGATLAGISQQFVLQLAQENAISIERRTLLPDDLLRADEAFLTSSTYCIVPVASYESTALPSVPGPLTTQLQRMWFEQVGMDFVAQAKQAEQDQTLRSPQGS